MIVTRSPSLDDSIAAKVSPLLQQEVAATGVADAIVILEESAAAAVHGSATSISQDLIECFVVDDRAPSMQILRARHPDVTLHVHRHATAATASLDIGANAPQPQRLQAFDGLGLLIGAVHQDGIARLLADPRVRYISSAMPFSLIRPRATAAMSASPARGTTWGIDAMNIPALWKLGLRGQGIRVGHLDTGADSRHPALKRALDSFLFVALDGQPGASGTAYDTDGHGTHTAATIVGRPVNGRYVGVAPGATLAVATVIEDGQVARRVITGLNWAVSQRVRIINMSLGFRGYHPDFYEIIRRVRERGILPVVAVGNEGPATSRSPGNYDNVLSAGACDERREIWQQSSSQIFERPNRPIVPNLVGPGVKVISAALGEGWMSLDGSSMAAPHISGLAAVLWGAKQTATVEEIENCILRSADCGRMNAKQCGSGLPDGLKAYRLLMNRAPKLARLSTQSAKPQSAARKGSAKPAPPPPRSGKRIAKRQSKRGTKR